MKIALVQADGKIPNLALMKIAGYHIRRSDTVEWYVGGLFANSYNKIYVSKIFDFSPMPEIIHHDISIGGTGIDHFNKLPADIESCPPDYSLYPECNYHLGFSQKGCRFRCKFCVVPKKEGRAYAANTIDELLINPRGGNRLMLLDNDFFGGPEWLANITRIIDLRLKVCFCQGLNIRILTPEQARMLSETDFRSTKFVKRRVTFAWDRYDDKDIILRQIEMAIRAGIKPHEMQFFVLVGFDTTHEQNLDRVNTLYDIGCEPFVMPYNKSDPYQRRFARWVNHKAIFKSVDFEDYLNKSLQKVLLSVLPGFSRKRTGNKKAPIRNEKGLFELPC